MEEETILTEPASGPMPSRKVLVTVIVALAVAVAVSVGYLLWRSAQETDPQAAAQKEARELAAIVSVLIVLPDDEDPVIATVADPELLKDQAFFAKAKVGDKVLIYNKARKAILYSPSENRIVEVAPLNIGN